MSKWIEYGKTWKTFYEEGLHLPGTKVELQGCDSAEKREWLILYAPGGWPAINGGGDTPPNDSTTVIRYRIPDGSITMQDFIEISHWIEYGKSWSQFCKDGLNNSGTQVRITNVSVPNEFTTYLIGDVSENGNQAASICIQCVEIQQEEIVIRYRAMEIDNG